MNQSFKWKKLNFVECGQHYSINLDTNEIRNDNSLKILKPQLNNKGYYRIGLHMNGKGKYYYVHVLVYMAYYGLYDTRKYDIDHIDHCRTNNNIGNLRLVNRSTNNINRSQHNGKQFDFQSVLPDATIINEECKIYYCKQYDKFYRKVAKNQFREIREYKQTYNNTTYIQWNLNNKKYYFTTSNFRDLI